MHILTAEYTGRSTTSSLSPSSNHIKGNTHVKHTHLITLHSSCPHLFPTLLLSPHTTSPRPLHHSTQQLHTQAGPRSRPPWMRKSNCHPDPDHHGRASQIAIQMRISRISWLRTGTKTRAERNAYVSYSSSV